MRKFTQIKGDFESFLQQSCPNLSNKDITRALEMLTQKFDFDFYLTQNPDVLKFDGDPLSHYLAFGWSEARRIRIIREVSVI